MDNFQESSKKCRGCNMTQSLCQFYRHDKGIDGYDSQCKSCKQKSSRRNYLGKIVSSSKNSDRIYNRLYKIEEYITKEWIQIQLEKQQERCFYCAFLMLYGKETCRKDPDGLTIERENNDIAHIKLNCVLACFRCNELTQKLPGDIMESGYGPNLKSGLLRWCGGKLHDTNDDRVRMPEDFGINNQYCKKCYNYKNGLFREKKRKTC
jgi:hypothetical protein